MTEIKISEEAWKCARSELNLWEQYGDKVLGRNIQLLLNTRDAELALSKTRLAVAEAHLENIRTVNQELRDNLNEAVLLIELIGTTGVERTDAIRKAEQWLKSVKGEK